MAGKFLNLLLAMSDGVGSAAVQSEVANLTLKSHAAPAFAALASKAQTQPNTSVECERTRQLHSEFSTYGRTSAAPDFSFLLNHATYPTQFRALSYVEKFSRAPLEKKQLSPLSMSIARDLKTAEQQEALGDRISKWIHEEYSATTSKETTLSHGNESVTLPSPRTDPDAYPHRAGLIAKLYQSCQKAWKLIIDGNVPEDAEEMHMARNEAGRFNIWGDGFGAGDGGLDELLDGLETMQETIVVLIARVAQKLLQCVFI